MTSRPMNWYTIRFKGADGAERNTMTGGEKSRESIGKPQESQSDSQSKLDPFSETIDSRAGKQASPPGMPSSSEDQVPASVGRYEVRDESLQFPAVAFIRTLCIEMVNEIGRIVGRSRQKGDQS